MNNFFVGGVFLLRSYASGRSYFCRSLLIEMVKLALFSVFDCKLPVDDIELNVVLIADHVCEEGQVSDIQRNIDWLRPQECVHRDVGTPVRK